MSLEDVAKTTKVPVRVLSAIEDEEFDLLPGGMYRRAYVKSFAAAVGLRVITVDQIKSVPRNFWAARRSHPAMSVASAHDGGPTETA